ncbi:hypothetical protein UlMin_035070 [Ulmus minor]
MSREFGAKVQTTKLASSFGLCTKPNLTCFHSLFKFYCETKYPKQTLLLFRELLESNAKPNELTFALLLKATASAVNLKSVKAIVEANQIRTHLIKSSIGQFIHVSTALLDLYAKLGCLKIACQVFDDMRERDVVYWNALISGFSRNGYDLDALELFVQMCRKGFGPCRITLVSLVPSCARHGLISQGKSIHGFGVKTGLDLDSQVKIVLTSMYAKCADLEAAEGLFEQMVDKSVVSWNTMVAAYGQNAKPVTLVYLLSTNDNPDSIHCFSVKTGLSHAEKGNILSVMQYFAQMQQFDMKPDHVAMVSILQGITDPAHFHIGLAFHCYSFKSGLSIDILVANGLISMYSKFDDIEVAFSIFSEMHEKTLISWNSLMSGCVHSERSSDAFELFCELKMSGHCPDSISMASLLSGCCQLGYLQFGEKLHSYVLRNNLEIDDYVGTALIDMVFKSMKEQCLATWNSMISGYSLCGLEHKALSCYYEMREQGLVPDKITFVGVLAACT